MESPCADISFHWRERPTGLWDSVLMQKHVNWFFTCIVAESLSLFSPPVQPGTEAHEDNPAGPSQASNEGRLLHYVWDAIVAFRSRHYISQFCTWGYHTQIHTYLISFVVLNIQQNMKIKQMKNNVQEMSINIWLENKKKSTTVKDLLFRPKCSLKRKSSQWGTQIKHQDTWATGIAKTWDHE